MPTPSLLVAMLELGRIDGAPLTDPAPWNWPEWVELTQRDHPPYIKEATPESTGMPADKLAAAKAFAQAYYAHTDQTARINYGVKTKGNDFAGREALRRWFKDESAKWGINAIIDKIMADHGRDMYSLSAEDGDQVSGIGQF